MPTSDRDAPLSERLGGPGFRQRLVVAMMLAISGVTLLGLYLAQTKMAASVEREVEGEFQAELKRLGVVQDLRRAALAERCRALIRRPRIHAALEDDALDLLYPSASGELGDLAQGSGLEAQDDAGFTLRGRFYRFLDAHGAVIPPGNATEAGALSKAQEAQLTLPAPPPGLELGYLLQEGSDGLSKVDEIIAMPIISEDTGDPIASLVVGFRPAELDHDSAAPAARNGVWTRGQLCMPGLSPALRDSLSAELRAADALKRNGGRARTVVFGGAPYLLLSTPLNPGSHYAAAYEVTLYSLADELARQNKIRWQILAAGAGLLLGGYAVSRA